VAGSSFWSCARSETRRIRGTSSRYAELVTDDAQPQPDLPPNPTVNAPAKARVRLLVAEDETLIRLDLVEMLVEAGYDVVAQVSDGEQAVAVARELKPDLVMMDIRMPVLDGISAAEQIGKERIAPVVMLTAFSQKELVERARDAGVMAYIVKPFTASDLAPAVEIARSRWVEMQALESEVADIADRLATRKVVDRAKGMLMTRLKITESEAFRWIQKTAMDRRLGMREVADAVVSDLLEEPQGS
jgi:two-component system, response regulator PdtaR